MIEKPGMKAVSQQRALPKMIRVYLWYMLGLLVFYLASPAISYFVFWGIFPRFSLSAIHGALLMPALALRVILLLTDQLTIHNRYLALGYLLLLWISMLQLIWFPYVSAQVGSESFFSTIAFTFIGAWLLWLGGEALAYLIAYRSGYVRTVIFIAYLSLTFILLDGVRKAFMLYGKSFFAFQDPVSRELYNYLTLADSIAILGLLIIATLSNSMLYRSLSIYLFTLMLLLFAYSRTSLFLFMFVGLLLLYIKFWRRQKQHLLLTFLVVVIIALIALMFRTALRGLAEILAEKGQLVFNRVSAVFSETDPSLQTRRELLRQGLRLLKQHWLMGYFMYETVETGRGSYIHNWLSFWLAYGIGPFIISIWLSFSLIVKTWKQRLNTSLATVGFSLLVFAALAVALSRSYIWPYFWFCLSSAGAGLLPRKWRTQTSQ